MYIARDSRYGVMPYNHTGKSGLKLPAVSLGLWHNFGARDSFDNMVDLLTCAFDNGITHFDLANNYGPLPGAAEENFGKIMSTVFKQYRDELVISTKAGYTMWDGPYGDFGSRKYLLSSLDQSLKRMNIDYVDIFYHHRMDKDTPLEESMGALATAVSSGKALYAGISNYNRENTAKAAAILHDLKCPFIINQRRYSILDRTIEEDGAKNYCAQNSIGIITFSPLAQGLLSDRYLHGIPQDSRVITSGVFLRPEQITQEKLSIINKLNDIAAARSQTLAQMALAWVLKDKDITSVLIGASKQSQILDNISAVKNCHFSRAELIAIDNAIKG